MGYHSLASVVTRHERTNLPTLGHLIWTIGIPKAKDGRLSETSPSLPCAVARVSADAARTEKYQIGWWLSGSGCFVLVSRLCTSTTFALSVSRPILMILPLDGHVYGSVQGKVLSRLLLLI